MIKGYFCSEIVSFSPFLPETTFQLRPVPSNTQNAQKRAQKQLGAVALARDGTKSIPDLSGYLVIMYSKGTDFTNSGFWTYLKFVTVLQ